MNSSVDSTITLVQLNAQVTVQGGHSAKLTARTLLKASKVDLHVIETHSGRRGIAPPILTLGAGWKCVVNFIPRPLYPLRENPGTLRIPGRSGEQDNLRPLLEAEHRTNQPVD